MTIGDVLATVDGILAACASLWAALVLCTLLFERRARYAADAIEQHPWRCLGAGLGVGSIAALIGVACVSQGSGALKLIGWVSLALLISQITLGASGFSLLIADRIRRNDDGLSRFQSTARAAGIQVAAALIPLLGWLIGAASIVASLGAVVLTARSARMAMRQERRERAASVVTPPPSAQSYAVE
jgi:hypothetical protein